MKALAIGILMWMQANCDVPGVAQEHNYCNLNWNQSVPEIVIMPQRQLDSQFICWIKIIHKYYIKRIFCTNFRIIYKIKIILVSGALHIGKSQHI